MQHNYNRQPYQLLAIVPLKKHFQDDSDFLEISKDNIKQMEINEQGAVNQCKMLIVHRTHSNTKSKY